MINFENWLDEVRIELYEQTKNLRKEEIIEVVNANAEKIADRYGFNIVKTALTA
ncbi:hypothetical protein NO1_2177 [Candidatus Termititenax aidoneus]|uniref:Uncharacterized protein n=1 Tax=Termititenax aidoneus TaxID=2218524 RepID=A0A388TDS7_TERA1|nr:hypothetical protein NO1_2177 [Candidatus Termititenax aidoneus]